MTQVSTPVTPPVQRCADCRKPMGLCLCADIRASGALSTRLWTLVLQHPQEKIEALATVPLLALGLKRARVAIGLSWPNFARAWEKSKGAELEGATPILDPKRWAVIYLGSGLKGKNHPDLLASEVVFVNKKGEATRAPEERLEGIVLLDGTLEPSQDPVVAQTLGCSSSGGRCSFRASPRCIGTCARSLARNAFRRWRALRSCWLHWARHPKPERSLRDTSASF